MTKKAWIALVDWVDGEVADTDEIRVYASTAGEATNAARTAWSTTNGAEWPHCRIEHITVSPPARLRRFA